MASVVCMARERAMLAFGAHLISSRALHDRDKQLVSSCFASDWPSKKRYNEGEEEFLFLLKTQEKLRAKLDSSSEVARVGSSQVCRNMRQHSQLVSLSSCRSVWLLHVWLTQTQATCVWRSFARKSSFSFEFAFGVCCLKPAECRCFDCDLI